MDVDNMLAELNADFAMNNVGITFYAQNVEFHEHPTLDTIGFGDAVYTDILAMKQEYAENTNLGCNVFISAQEPGVGEGLYRGFGALPWSLDPLGVQGGIWINSIACGTGFHALTHELGHVLGLQHTFYGVSEVPECGSCYEYADGTEGDLRGDFCSDTPPTPKNKLCTSPGGTDCTAYPWGPTQPENVMSYSPDVCRYLFTTQQIKRMRCWANAALSDWLLTPIP